MTAFLKLGICFAALLLLAVDTANSSDQHDKAEEYYDYGMYLASQGALEGALPFFRAAVKLNPHHVNYVHDLGVTEAQLGHFVLAEKRFLAAIRLNPKFSDAISNLERVQHDMRVRNLATAASCSSTGRRHDIAPIPEISVEDVSNHNIIHPFIIRNFTNSMHWTIENIMSRVLSLHSDATADFYPQNMISIPTKVFFLPLSTAWNQLHFPDGLYSDIDASLPGIYFQWNLKSGEWSSILALLNASLPLSLYNKEWLACIDEHVILDDFMKQTHWNMLLVGEAGSGMFNHVDTLRTASFQVQLEGSKKWHICGPENTELLYEPGEIDAFYPDYNKYPLFAAASCMEDTVNAGDLIYYPHDHWHQTVNTALSIAISSTVLTQDCYKDVLVVQASECLHSVKYQLPNELCEKIETCRKHLNELFSPS